MNRNPNTNSKGSFVYFLGLIIATIFFMVSLMTLGDYGISWDEPVHFTRGQAYLNYFLTGELTYQNLPSSKRRSHYQDSSHNGQFFLKNDSGHPPLNGIMAALSNLIFYQRLGILGDIQSYHLFNILSATFLVAVVAIFAMQAYGVWAAIFAALSLSVYPLFFAEAHFNIKDPAEAAFFTATIWAFWNCLKRYRWRWLMASVLFFALGLGIKFNILFLPGILIIWLIVRFGYTRFNPSKIIKLPRKFFTLLVLSPFIVISTFLLSWPYLWQDPLTHTFNIFRYYKEIGTGGLGQPQFIIGDGFNLFPIVWILLTTPPIVLFLTILGIIAVVLKRCEKEKTAFLWLAWLIIPILRVSVPGSSIYGGVRQIMEFLPAMALLSGLGAQTLVEQLKSVSVFTLLPKILFPVLVLILFIPHLLVMVKMHPNENVYFNFLIGGLKGAKKANIPYWGNSFGNAYYQAAQWINDNAPPGSRVALVQGTSVNIPPVFFVPQIYYSNSAWSGINREGEYLVELTHQGNEIAYPFAWEYIKNVLIPVYEVSVDEVVIAKVWKNDIEHSRSEYQTEETIPIKKVQQNNDFLEIEFERVYALARLRLEFNDQGNCQPFKLGIIQTSLDKRQWRTEAEKISDYQIKSYHSLENGLVRYIFPANRASSIRIKTESASSCLFQNPAIKIWGFKTDN